MQLIILYGPPAVGKLTVARELAALTKYKLLHNHLTVNLAKELFEFGSDAYWHFLDELRLSIIELTGQAGLLGLIFTFVYAHPEDLPFVERVRQIMCQHGGDTLFVQLVCPASELKRRVESPNRKTWGKMTSSAALEEFMTKWDLQSPVPGVESLTINTDILTPAAAAKQIAEVYNLLPNAS